MWERSENGKGKDEGWFRENVYLDPPNKQSRIQFCKSCLSYLAAFTLLTRK